MTRHHSEREEFNFRSQPGLDVEIIAADLYPTMSKEDRAVALVNLLRYLEVARTIVEEVEREISR